jgi:hypothetical protein
MQAISLSVTELVRNFSDYINRTAYRNERFILTKGRKAVAELRPVPSGRTLGELPALLESLPSLSEEDADGFLADIDEARASLPSAVGDPWRS